MKLSKAIFKLQKFKKSINTSVRQGGSYCQKDYMHYQFYQTCFEHSISVLSTLILVIIRTDFLDNQMYHWLKEKGVPLTIKLEFSCSVWPKHPKAWCTSMFVASIIFRQTKDSLLQWQLWTWSQQLYTPSHSLHPPFQGFCWYLSCNIRVSKANSPPWEFLHEIYMNINNKQKRASFRLHFMTSRRTYRIVKSDKRSLLPLEKKKVNKTVTQTVESEEG